MSPRKRPAYNPGSNQGAFFGAESDPDGTTDPDSFAMTARIVVPPEGEVYYPPTPPVDGGVVTVEAVHDQLEKEAEDKRRRRRGSEGLKAAANDSETYVSYLERTIPGYFLPSFGPVKYSNWEDAKQFAKGLDRKRLAKERANPTLDSDVRDVQPVVEALVSALSLERSLSHDDEITEGVTTQPAEVVEQTLSPQITSEQKFAIIREKAGFTPATHDEKNTAIGLIFSATERGSWWVHAHLTETYDHLVKHYKNKEGLKFKEAKEKARDGVVSRINEMGDYLQEAIDDGTALQWLQQKLDTATNPGVTLEEVVTDSFEPVDPAEDEKTKDRQLVLWAMAAVVRYRDLETQQDLPFLPLTEREDRSIDGDQEGKNKQLYNPYVAAFMLTDDRPEIMDKYAAIRAHVMNQVRAITAGELRALVPRVLEDQRNRYGFWKQALLDVKGSYKQVALRRVDS